MKKAIARLDEERVTAVKVNKLGHRPAFIRPHQAAVRLDAEGRVMGGTGVRLFVTLLAAWLLTQSVPFFRDGSFWNWLLGAYLVTLALEITLLLAGRPASAPKS